MSEVEGLLIPPNGPAQLVKVGTDTRELAKVIGAESVEMIFPRPSRQLSEAGEWHAYVDEDGYPKHLPPNWGATTLAVMGGWPGGQALVGTVLFIGESDVEGEDGDIPPGLLNQEAAMRVAFNEARTEPDLTDPRDFSEDGEFRS